MRDMFVFDWLFGQRKKESFWERHQSDSRRSSHYEYGGRSHYSHNDRAQQDFDDDLDSGMYDDF